MLPSTSHKNHIVQELIKAALKIGAVSAITIVAFSGLHHIGSTSSYYAETAISRDNRLQAASSYEETLFRQSILGTSTEALVPFSEIESVINEGGREEAVEDTPDDTTPLEAIEEPLPKPEETDTIEVLDVNEQSMIEENVQDIRSEGDDTSAPQEPSSDDKPEGQ